MYVCLGAVSLSLLRYRLFIKPRFDIQTGEKGDRKKMGVRRRWSKARGSTRFFFSSSHMRFRMIQPTPFAFCPPPHRYHTFYIDIRRTGLPQRLSEKLGFPLDKDLRLGHML